MCNASFSKRRGLDPHVRQLLLKNHHHMFMPRVQFCYMDYETIICLHKTYISPHSLSGETILLAASDNAYLVDAVSQCSHSYMCLYNILSFYRLLTDASSALFICVLLFAFPKHMPRFDGSKPTGGKLSSYSVAYSVAFEHLTILI